MRKTMSQYEYCKSLLTAIIFVKLFKNSGNTNSSMFYRDNIYAGRAGYQALRSGSLPQVHTNVHYCHRLSKELSKNDYQTYQRVENP